MLATEHARGRQKHDTSTGSHPDNRQVVEVLKVFNDHPGGIIVSSSWTGTENLVTCDRFGAEGSPLNNSRKVLESIGMVTEARLTIGTLRIYDGDGKDDASEKCVYILL